MQALRWCTYPYSKGSSLHSEVAEEAVPRPPLYMPWPAQFQNKTRHGTQPHTSSPSMAIFTAAEITGAQEPGDLSGVASAWRSQWDPERPH